MAKADTWRERVNEWRGSGLSAMKFAQSKGFGAHQLWYWASKFRDEEQARPGKPTATAAGPMPAEAVKADAIPFARVVRSHQQEGAKPQAPLSVELSEIRIVVPADLDRATLLMVLDAVQARRARLAER